MENLPGVNVDKGGLKTALISVLASLFALYIASMLIFPLYKYGWDWDQIQNVWSRWQSFNVGVLAFSASVVALSAGYAQLKHQKEARHRDIRLQRSHRREDRARKFLAAKAVMPLELSALIGYVRESMGLLREALLRVRNPGDRRQTPLDVSPPTFPDSCLPVFKDLIEHSDNQDLADSVAYLLQQLQIHAARMNEVWSGFGAAGPIDTYLAQAGKIYGLIGNLFPFARGEEEFVYSAVTEDNIRSGLHLSGIDPDELGDLQNVIAMVARAEARRFQELQGQA